MEMPKHQSDKYDVLPIRIRQFVEDCVAETFAESTRAMKKIKKALNFGIERYSPISKKREK